MFRAMIVALTALVCFNLVGCGKMFRVHRLDVQQGNIITDDMMHHLHKGMSRQQVLKVLGQPVLTTLFENNTLEYVYTWQPGYSDRTEKRLTIDFRNNKVVKYNLVTTTGK